MNSLTCSSGKLHEISTCGRLVLAGFFSAIGDGPVEIAEAKAMGGLAVAVAPDESNLGSRRFDEFKQRQLLQCGADLVVPDFLDAAALVDVLLGNMLPGTGTGS